MNRFFSKLDLRDIKIDPTGSRFPPEGETFEDDIAAEPEAVTAYENPFPPDEREPIILEADEPEAVEAEPFVAPEPRAVGTSEVLKVSAKSRPSAVAGAIAGVVREAGRAEVQAIGAGATNQAVKAVAIARDYLRESGIEAVCLPSFIDVTIDNEDRTAILLVVEPR
jgi:stage V sporulation protein S